MSKNQKGLRRKTHQVVIDTPDDMHVKKYFGPNFFNIQ